MAVTSINLGRPLVLSDPHSKIAQEIRRVAKTIVTGQMVVHEEPQPRRTIWNSLFKRESDSNHAPNQMELQVSTPEISL
jgi:MinD-like ATPase involved in chromosome partitioning or flagellar assembly